MTTPDTASRPAMVGYTRAWARVARTFLTCMFVVAAMASALFYTLAHDETRATLTGSAALVALVGALAIRTGREAA